MLAVSGRLNLEMGGPGFNFFKSRGGLDGFPPIESFGPEGRRRMIYAHKVRMEREIVFGAFDCPDAGQTLPRRRQSTTPIQALNLFNSRFTIDEAVAFAKRLEHELGPTADASQKVPVARAGGTTDSLPMAIREAIRLFETHVEDPLRIPDVAAAVGLSGRHFERMFKRETGQSPLRYYHQLRLMKARQRVLYSNDSFREIAASVGYMSSGPMSRHYLELFGVSPRDERRLTQNLRRAAPQRVEAAVPGDLRELELLLAARGALGQT